MVQADPRGVGSQRQVAELFGVSRSFVEQLFMRLRITGQATPKAHAGGKPSRPDANARLCLHKWRQEQSDLTLDFGAVRNAASKSRSSLPSVGGQEEGSTLPSVGIIVRHPPHARVRRWRRCLGNRKGDPFVDCW